MESIKILKQRFTEISDNNRALYILMEIAILLGKEAYPHMFHIK